MIGEATAIWHWTILESSGRWYRAVCRYVSEATPQHVTLQVEVQSLLKTTALSLVVAEATQQVILWELDAVLSNSWSAEQTVRVQSELRQLKQLEPQIKQIVALRLDQASQAPLWYDTGADAVLMHFQSLSALAMRFAFRSAKERS